MPCLDCGEVSEDIRCEQCSPSSTEQRGTSFRQRGYDAAWDRLSRRARALQPFCSDCGTTKRLTADHLPSAWERKARGLAVRLQDVEVVCAPCNDARGSSRPGSDRALGGHPHLEARSAGTQGQISDSPRPTSNLGSSREHGEVLQNRFDAESVSGAPAETRFRRFRACPQGPETPDLHVSARCTKRGNAGPSVSAFPRGYEVAPDGHGVED